MTGGAAQAATGSGSALRKRQFNSLSDHPAGASSAKPSHSRHPPPGEGGRLDLSHVGRREHLQEVACWPQELAQAPDGPLQLDSDVVVELLVYVVYLSHGRLRLRRWRRHEQAEPRDPLATLAEQRRDGAVLILGGVMRVVPHEVLDTLLEAVAHARGPPEAAGVALALHAGDAGLPGLAHGLVCRVYDMQDLPYALQHLRTPDGAFRGALRGPQVG
mmetsp:Transcript_33399/g.105853  ORF Transcript_33399/g.105853 Transcript_33399/m.105853 type:complete len:217 (-) Transcript_33399:278-928(-)